MTDAEILDALTVEHPELAPKVEILRQAHIWENPPPGRCPDCSRNAEEFVLCDRHAHALKGVL